MKSNKEIQERLDKITSQISMTENDFKTLPTLIDALVWVLDDSKVLEEESNDEKRKIALESACAKARPTEDVTISYQYGNLRQGLTKLFNGHEREYGNVPDYLLADYVMNCLETLKKHNRNIIDSGYWK
jgi:hypothetical protein